MTCSRLSGPFDESLHVGTIRAVSSMRRPSGNSTYRCTNIAPFIFPRLSRTYFEPAGRRLGKRNGFRRISLPPCTTTVTARMWWGPCGSEARLVLPAIHRTCGVAQAWVGSLPERTTYDATVRASTQSRAYAEWGNVSSWPNPDFLAKSGSLPLSGDKRASRNLTPALRP